MEECSVLIETTKSAEDVTMIAEVNATLMSALENKRRCGQNLGPTKS